MDVDVTFEPIRWGTVFRDTLHVKSSGAGEVVIPVIGTCIPPKPQGPIMIKSGSGNIQFKNVFNKETTFSLSIDNPAFSAKTSETIPSKRTVGLGISYSAKKDCSTTAQLVVSCDESPVPWVFYLTST